MKRAIYWFRNDQRIIDNPALLAAIDSSDEIIPVYIFDEAQYGKTAFGFDKTGTFRAKFIVESIQNLRENIRSRGGELIVRKGNAIEILNELKAEWQVENIFFSKEYTREELNDENKVDRLLDSARSDKRESKSFHSSTLFHPEELPFEIEKTPEVFTAFRKKCEKYVTVHEALQAPEKISTPEIMEPGEIPSQEELGLSTPNLDERAVLKFKGGEDEAWNRLNHYFWDTHCLAEYKETRNGLIGADYSSKFSPWLANGNISPRSIYAEVKRFEAEVTSNQSTYWLIFELIWRDYFKFIAMKHGDRLFYRSGIFDVKRKWSTDQKRFQSWAEGSTGEPFVDANMRELNATGFMSNRGRQNVASYLTKDLGIDWRMGAEYFESQLIDFDVCSNYGNWQYVAGVGNDPRKDRYFNVQKQAEHYDPNSAYQNCWLRD